jgi:hypothetical protein
MGPQSMENSGEHTKGLVQAALRDVEVKPKLDQTLK